MLISTMWTPFILGLILLSGGCGTVGIAAGEELGWNGDEFEIDRSDHVLRSTHGALLNLYDVTESGVRVEHGDRRPGVMVDGERRDELVLQDVYVRTGRALTYAHRSNGDVIAVWFDELTLVRHTIASPSANASNRSNSTKGVFVRLDASTHRMEINADGRTIHNGNQIVDNDAVSKHTPTEHVFNNFTRLKKANRQNENETTSRSNNHNKNNNNNNDGRKKNTCRNVKPVKLFEIAIAFDSELCARFGGDPNDVIGALYSLVTIANEPFRRSTCLKLVISHIDGYCERRKDPYVAFKKFRHEKSSRILFEIGRFWERNRGDVHRDAVLLMNGYLHDHFWGQAFVGATCERGGYAWVERLRRASTAHELGHLVGCTHENEGVMKKGASIQLGTAMRFTERNIDEIVQYVDDSPYARCITYERNLKASQLPNVSPSNSKTGSVSKAPLKSVSPSTKASVTMPVAPSRTPVPLRTPPPRRTPKQSPRARASKRPTKTAKRTPSGTSTGMKRSPTPSVSQKIMISVSPEPEKPPPAGWRNRTNTCAIGFSEHVALDCKPSERGLTIWTKLGRVSVDISQKYGRFATRLQIWKDEQTIHNSTVTTWTKSTLIGYKMGVFGEMQPKWPNLGNWKTVFGTGNNHNHNGNNKNETQKRKQTFFIFTRPNEIILERNGADSCCSKRIWAYIAVTVSKTTTVKRTLKSKPVIITNKTETGKGIKKIDVIVRCVDCGNKRAMPANLASAQMCPKCK